jgi:DNA-directed RNA polymerase subunit RPC12/RpoP
VRVADVRCPACGEDDNLTGARVEDAVSISCGACGTRFDRDLTPRCTACGSHELVAVATDLLADAGRGEMTTPTGIVERWLCWSCGAEDATSAGATPDGPDWREQRSDHHMVRHLRTRD